MYTYDYPKPSVATDLCIFTCIENNLHVLLVKRKNPPFENKWALPGGFLEEDETTEECALRELQEETGIKVSNVELGGINSDPERDPRERIISVSYFALIKLPEELPQAKDDAKEAKWFPLNILPKLAFDHQAILENARKKLRDKILYHPVGLGLLPTPFRIEDLHCIYEAILDKNINIRTLHRKLMKYNYVVRNTGTDVSEKKSARMYKFDQDLYREYSKSGFYLDLNEKK